ncbi:MAG TPA: HEAT repeat domain-containing protein [Gemmataceae bacterium]|nr:HEAT repeat domain-containing protein [Gemmataceae bacterium]
MLSHPRLPISLLGLLLTGAFVCAADEPRYAGKPLAFWLEELKSDDPLIREEAIAVLADAGPAARAAVPRLETLLKDQQRSVRTQAALALWRIAGQTKPAITALTEAVRDPATPNRAEMLGKLSEFGSAAASSAPAVVEFIRDANPVVRTQAVMAMQRFGATAVPSILPLLDHADRRVRRSACHALGLLGPSAKDAVPKLAALLKDADEEVRQESLATLGRIGSTARSAAPTLLEWTRDKNPHVRAAGLKGLQEIFADPKLARPAALDGLEDEDPLVRVRAVILLWRIAPKHADILPHTLELLKQPVGRIELLTLLGQLGPSAARAVPVLTKLLADHDFQVRRQAIQALGQMGRAARSAAPALTELLRPADFATRQTIVMALRAIGGDERMVPIVLEVAKQDMSTRMVCLPLLASLGPKASAATPWLVTELRRPPSYVTVQMAETLHKIDPERARKEAVPVLQTMLKPTAPWRVYAAMTLRRLKPDSDEALDTLIECVTGKDFNARQQACQFLGTLGKSARKAAPALRQALRDPAIPHRVAAASSLWQITGETKTTVPVLLEALKPSSVNYARYQAALHLGEMGPPIKTMALPTLQKFRNDPDLFVRNSVFQAIQRIDGTANKPNMP